MRRPPALVALVTLLAGCGGATAPMPSEARRARSEAAVGAVADGGSEPRRVGADARASVAPVPVVDARGDEGEGRSEPARGMSPVERAQREQQRLATSIQRGWTEAQVIALAGEPKSRTGGVWGWHFGLADGPRYDVLVTVREGRVVEVRTAVAACILRE